MSQPIVVSKLVFSQFNLDWSSPITWLDKAQWRKTYHYSNGTSINGLLSKCPSSSASAFIHWRSEWHHHQMPLPVLSPRGELPQPAVVYLPSTTMAIHVVAPPAALSGPFQPSCYTPSLELASGETRLGPFPLRTSRYHLTLEAGSTSDTCDCMAF